MKHGHMVAQPVGCCYKTEAGPAVSVPAHWLQVAGTLYSECVLAKHTTCHRLPEWEKGEGGGEGGTQQGKQQGGEEWRAWADAAAICAGAICASEVLERPGSNRQQVAAAQQTVPGVPRSAHTCEGAPLG
jgi:hypothetical protein